MKPYKENSLTVLRIALFETTNNSRKKIERSWQKTSRWKVNDFKREKQKILLDNDGKLHLGFAQNKQKKNTKKQNKNNNKSKEPKT